MKNTVFETLTINTIKYFVMISLPKFWVQKQMFRKYAVSETYGVSETENPKNSIQKRMIAEHNFSATTKLLNFVRPFLPKVRSWLIAKNARYFLLGFNDVKISKPTIIFRSSNILLPLERCILTRTHFCDPRSESPPLKIVAVLRFKLLRNATFISEHTTYIGQSSN
jgi:hypothetical protein